ncbi:MAG: BACON domain-containing protein [Candidatus Ventricola sp.]
MRRKLSAFVIMVLLMMHLFALSAYAETAQQDGLFVTLQTNRDVYDSNEQIQVSIEIKNTNETAVQNVKVMPYASEPYMLANANQSTINIGTMKDQSIEKVDIVFIRGEDIAITLPMTGDSSHPLFWGSCLVISLGIVCVLLKQKKGLRFLSLFLCLCICSSVISVHHAEASDAEAQMIVVEKTIDVAGESVTVGVGVSYNHVGNASQTGTLTASQTTILANSSASPVYFYVQADGEFTSVSLIDALTGLNVATMLDDGQYSISGDDLPNDDIYSCVVHVPSASVGTQRYYARMTDASNHTVLTNEVEISVVGKFTGTDLEAMDQVHDSLGMLVSSLEYQRMSIGERAEAIAEQLQVHAENGLIDGSSIKYDTRNQIYTFTHANGVLGGVMLAPFHSDLNGSAPMTRAERETAALAKQQQKQMRSFALMRMMPANAYEDMEIGDAMIFYAFDEAVNSSRYPHYLSMANDWSARGLNTSIDQAVTVEELKSIDDYKVAVLSMHGVCYQSRDKSGAVLCLQEEATESKNKLYTSDLKKRNLATVTLDNGKTCYWVFASFFEDHYGANDLQNTFIFSEACSFWGENSTSDKSMALAFEKAGATAVVGFYNPVYTEYSRDMLQHYVDSLLDGKTAYEALMAGQKKYGSDDSKYTGSTSNSLFSFVKGAAYALFGGSTDSQLIASDLKNTSFEQASSASGWNTTGDVRVLTKLASLKPTNGSRMAILTTGIGSAESSYLEGTEGSILSQSFIVPSEAGAVQFQYDVVSEEPMEYVDSIFDDKFVVRILGSNGQVYKEKTIESVNESTWYSISGIDFEGGDDTTYHTQWKTGVIDISEYRNQAITLQFVVYDMGDSIYDTAALIDDVKLLSGSGFEIDECSLHLSTSSWTPILTGESKTVSVTKHDGSSFSVKVTQLDPNGNALDSANEWLTVSKSGSSIKLTATANYAAQPRTATVTVTCACGGTKKLIVTQMSGAPKPTLQLRIGDSYYGDNDTYGTLTAGDTLYLTAEFTNAKRLYIRVYNPQTGESVVDKTFDSEVAGSSANYYPVFNKNLESGIYVVEATVSNSDIRNAVWAQKVTKKIAINLVVSSNDDPTYSEDELVTIAKTIIFGNEGGYTTVNKNDGGSMSIGKLQWNANAGNALPLLRSIINKNPSNALSILGADLYYEITNPNTSWTNANRTATAEEAKAISKLLGTTEGKQVQDAEASARVAGYLNSGKKYGLTDPQALVYYADLYNQRPASAISIVKEAIATAGSADKVTLDIIHQAAMNDAILGEYESRRTKTYEKCKDIEISTPTEPEMSGGTNNYPANLYITQTPKQCTYASAAMLIRAIAYKNEWSDWISITESSVDAADGAQSGLRWDFTYYLNDHTIRLKHGSTAGFSISELKAVLKEHPEGIVLYCDNAPHAVFLTDYDGDTFYCADPQSPWSGTRRTLDSSYLGKVYGSQSNILNNATSYWYVYSAQ